MKLLILAFMIMLSGCTIYINCDSDMDEHDQHGIHVYDKAGGKGNATDRKGQED